MVSTGGSARTPGCVAAGGALAAWLSAAVLLCCGATAAAASGPGDVIGGPRLGGNGLIVGYPAAAHPIIPLPRIVTSAFVVADAGTGQVLAARNPHGYFRPASTLKVLTAVTFIPVLDPNATVVASRLATWSGRPPSRAVPGRHPAAAPAPRTSVSGRPRWPASPRQVPRPSPPSS
jgi:D-Ala-D-Ala carboxypeptidase 3 (S13) family